MRKYAWLLFALFPILLGCGAAGPTTPPVVELTVPSGHNIGLDCTAASCHGSNPSPSAAGTVYQDTAGTTTVSGVTVRFTQVLHPTVSVTATTNADGNFALSETALDPAQKYSVSISSGPISQSMTMTRTPPISCNFCHSPGGPAAGFRVNLQGAP